MKTLMNYNFQCIKGAIHIKMNISLFIVYDLLIMPLTLIFHFGETPENGRGSWQKNV